MIWQARARKDYICDNCGGIIKKHNKRVVTGQKGLAYQMIDRNLHIWCFEEAKEILGDNPQEFVAEYLKKAPYIEGLYGPRGIWVKKWILKEIAKESTGFSYKNYELIYKKNEKEKG